MKLKYLKKESCYNCRYSVLKYNTGEWICQKHNKHVPESRLCRLWLHFSSEDESANENYTEPQSWEGGFADNH